MRGLQVGIEAIQGVAQTVLIQRHGLGAHIEGHDLGSLGGFADVALVDVIAQVQHEIEVLLRHVAIGCVVSIGPILAGHKGESQLLGASTWRRSRLGASHGAENAAALELVPVVSSRLQPGNFDVNRVAPIGARRDFALLHDLLHALVRGDLPAHGDVLGLHASAIEGIDGEASPQHHAIGQRVARGHAERKRPAPNLDLRCDLRRLRHLGRSASVARGHGAARSHAQPAQESATVKGWREDIRGGDLVEFSDFHVI